MSDQNKTLDSTESARREHSLKTVLRLFVPSVLGILIFFVPLTLGGRTTCQWPSEVTH